MALSLTRVDPAAEGEELVAFLTGNRFPFHVTESPTRGQVVAALRSGAYGDDDHAAFWLTDDTAGRVGLARLEDLQDPTPMLDLRIAERVRGRGFGAAALRSITELVFTTMPEVNRFEGQTREDNIAMRKTFLRCGWVKEAHYREAWPVAGGAPVASVAYAILRRDWATGTTTPVPWADGPHP